MTNPCPGHSVTTPYGKPGGWAAGYHTGADYACGAGTPIVAATAGVVVSNAWNDDYGNYVQIETSGIRHRYCHLREPSPLNIGQHVSEGQHIGNAGSTGNSTGPHLHYEERFDPYGYWEHREPQFNSEAGGGTTGDAYPPPISATVYLSKLRYGQQNSDSVWYLQDTLNRHSLPAPGNVTLPLTGNYFDQTGTVVVTCQQHHGYGNDPVNASYVGPSQAQHLFAGSGLTIVDDR